MLTRVLLVALLSIYVGLLLHQQTEANHLRFRQRFFRRPTRKCAQFGRSCGRNRPSRRPAKRPSPANQNVDKIARDFINDDDEMIPNLVQMVFHSCVGGCDGCLNMKEADNKGLRSSYKTVRKFCDDSLGSLSLADCIVLLASRAVEIGMEKDKDIKNATVRFTPGRTTCGDPDRYHRELIFPQGDKTDAVSFLKKEFSLSSTEAVALLGAHSLGRMRKENSGFEHSWDRSELTLDNSFYKSLRGVAWTAKSVGGKTMWMNNGGELGMLHADMSLQRNFTLDADGQPSCQKAKECPLASTSQLVETYATNSTRWMKDFIRAFVKMCDNSAQSTA